MDLPLLGLALKYENFAELRDWIRDPGRAVEIQDFVMPAAVMGDWQPQAAAWAKGLDGHSGKIGIHGPFFGLDIANPDPELRAVITKRLLQGLQIAEAVNGTHMVVHSPFTYWHVLNRRNFAYIHGSMLEAAAECLAPVLTRAADIGCTLMLENIDDTDPADRRALVEMVDHPNLRLSIDTGHAELAHGRRLILLLMQAACWAMCICKTQMALPIGTGIPWKAVCCGLRSWRLLRSCQPHLG